MEIVVDASALVAVLLRESDRDFVQAATTGVDLCSPTSLPMEVGNALVRAARRGRISREEAVAGWSEFTAMEVRLIDIEVSQAISLAVECGLYAYDGYVLKLARSRDLPLLTLDRKLNDTALRIGVRRWEA